MSFAQCQFKATRNYRFTKTGSGQTKGKHSQSECRCFLSVVFSGRDMFTSVGQRMFPLPLSAPYHPSMLDPKVRMRGRTHSTLSAACLDLK